MRTLLSSLLLLLALSVADTATAQSVHHWWICGDATEAPPAPKETTLMFSLTYRGGGDSVVSLFNTYTTDDASLSIKHRIAKVVVDNADRTASLCDTTHRSVSGTALLHSMGYNFGDTAVHAVDIYAYKDDVPAMGSMFHSITSLLTAVDRGSLSIIRGCLFKDATSLSTVVLSEKVDTIGHQVFASTFPSQSSLTDVVIKSPAPPVLLREPPETGMGLWFLLVKAGVTLHIMPGTRSLYDVSDWLSSTWAWPNENIVEDADKF